MPRSTVLGLMAPAVAALAAASIPAAAPSSVRPTATDAADGLSPSSPTGAEPASPVPGAWATLENGEGGADIIGFHGGRFHPIATVAPQGPRTSPTARLLSSAPLLRAELIETRAVMEALAATPGVWDALIRLTGTPDLERALVGRLAHLRRAHTLAGLDEAGAPEVDFTMPPEEVPTWVPEHAGLLADIGV